MACDDAHPLIACNRIEYAPQFGLHLDQWVAPLGDAERSLLYRHCVGSAGFRVGCHIDRPIQLAWIATPEEPV